MFVGRDVYIRLFSARLVGFRLLFGLAFGQMVEGVSVVADQDGLRFGLVGSRSAWGWGWFCLEARPVMGG